MVRKIFMVICPSAKNLVCKKGPHIPEKNWKYLLGGGGGDPPLPLSSEGYVSVSSKPDHPPGDPRVFAPLSCPGEGS